MGEIKRTLNMKLPKGQSAFLWGPRKTGKTTFLKENFSNSTIFDFLNTDLYLECLKRPARLREYILALPREKKQIPIIIDEVQKVPAVLDEIHWMIEHEKLSFILCGSSARKLKRGHANMLGGRAWRFEMHPFVSCELNYDLDLLRVFNQGMLPSHYLSDKAGAKKFLKAYVQDYLTQEIFEEGLVRNMPAFSRFFDAVGFSHGEIINYANIASDCGVDAKTVKSYYQILIDTLLGVSIEPYAVRQKRKVILSTPKFYLFDTGVAGIICKREINVANGAEFGKAFEHFICMELHAYKNYLDKDFKISYWRTKTGLEVDFILGQGEVAIEVKSGNNISSTQLKGINAFAEENPKAKTIVVTTESMPRMVGKILLVPWKVFLKDLWEGKVI